jgi:hypothetical protein
MKTLAIILTALVGLGMVAIAADSPADQPRTFRTDADGFIQNWLVLEPIRLTGIQHTEAGVRGAIDRVDGQISNVPTSQSKSLFKAGDKATVDGVSLQWQAVSAASYIVDLTGFATRNGKPNVNVMFCGIAYVTVPEEIRDVRLAIGSDDDSVWWVNGKEVIHAFGVRQTATDDSCSKRLTLSKGVNVVRFAVIQGDGPSDCCARFLDMRQKPITNITISVETAGAATTPTAK